MGTALNTCWGNVSAFGAAGTAGSTTTGSLQATSSKVGVVFTMDCDDATVAVSHLWFRMSSMTGTPGAASYMISLQTVDSSGNPSGNDVATGSAASAGTGTATSFTPAAGDTSGRWVALGNSYTATRGDRLAVVVEHIVVDTTNYITAAIGHSEWNGRNAAPYVLTHNGTSWTKNSATGTAFFAWKNSGQTVTGGAPIKAMRVGSAFGNTVETGMTFTVPTDFCSTFKVKGVRWRGTTPASGANTYAARLYTTPTGTPSKVQETTTIDNDVVSTASGGDRSFELYFPESSLAVLSAGTKYGVGLSTTTASAMDLEYADVQTAADFDALPWRQATAIASRTNASYPPAASTVAFTETTTRRPVLELILADVTPPSGGGGLAANPLVGFVR